VAVRDRARTRDGLRIREGFNKLSDDDLNYMIRALDDERTLDIISKYGDMDHPSIVLRKLLLSTKAPRLLKLIRPLIKLAVVKAAHRRGIKRERVTGASNDASRRSDRYLEVRQKHYCIEMKGGIMDAQVDVQANRPEFSINLTRVGVTNVKKLIKVTRRDKRPVILVSEFDLFVDLPSDRKGANLSRNFEVMDEALEDALNAPVYEIEQFCGGCRRKAARSTRVCIARRSAHMRSEYIGKTRNPSTGITTQEITNIFAETTT